MSLRGVQVRVVPRPAVGGDYSFLADRPCVMSALPQKADTAQRDYHIRFVACPLTTVSAFLIL